MVDVRPMGLQTVREYPEYIQMGPPEPKTMRRSMRGLCADYARALLVDPCAFPRFGVYRIQVYNKGAAAAKAHNDRHMHIYIYIYVYIIYIYI